MSSHIGEIVLGVMLTAFAALLWRYIDGVEKRIEKRFDGIDGRLGVIEGDLRQFYSVTGELKGRVDEISHRVK